MAVDFKEGDESTADFESLFAKLESLADQTPDPDDLPIQITIDSPTQIPPLAQGITQTN